MGMTRTIEVDEATAAALELAAADGGLSVGEFVAEFANLVRPDVDGLAELDRRWAAVEAGEESIPHEAVDKWMSTWGTPDFKPWGKG